MATEPEQYYALCTKGDDGETEVAFLSLGYREGLGTMLGMAVYTAPDGAAQQQDLNDYPDTLIAPVSHEDLLDAANRGMPTSVFYDGQKIAGSVLKGMLKDALGLPIRHPRVFDRDRIFPEDEGT